MGTTGPVIKLLLWRFVITRMASVNSRCIQANNVQWVVANIAQFGGDPNQITIAGERYYCIDTCPAPNVDHRSVRRCRLRSHTIRFTTGHRQIPRRNCNVQPRWRYDPGTEQELWHDVQFYLHDIASIHRRRPSKHSATDWM